jgi:hypothetical protein
MTALTMNKTSPKQAPTPKWTQFLREISTLWASSFCSRHGERSR